MINRLQVSISIWYVYSKIHGQRFPCYSTYFHEQNTRIIYRENCDCTLVITHCILWSQMRAVRNSPPMEFTSVNICRNQIRCLCTLHLRPPKQGSSFFQKTPTKTSPWYTWSQKLQKKNFPLDTLWSQKLQKKFPLDTLWSQKLQKKTFPLIHIDPIFYFLKTFGLIHFDPKSFSSKIFLIPKIQLIKVYQGVSKCI